MTGHVGYHILEIPSHSIVLCFSQWIIKYNLIQKYFKFILEIPCHKYWVRKYVRKYVGIPNFLTILSTLYKNCFQQAGVPFTMNENALSLAINLSIVPLRLFLAMLSVSAPALVLCIAKFIDERKWCSPYTDQANNM